MFSASKRTIGTLLIAAAFVLPGGLDSPCTLQAQSGQAAARDAKEFAGTWNWMYRDKRFATMILQVEGDQLGGSITNGSIEMDGAGRITKAVPGKGSSAILRTSLQNGVLHIVAKDGKEEMELAMTLTSPNTAELRFAGADAPSQAEAIKLEKVWSEPPVEP